MVTDAAGALWPVIEVVGPIVLLAALIYGTLVYRRRSARLNQEANAETRRIYQQRDG